MKDALTFFVEPVLENATLIAAFEGWNDAGEAATGAARYVEAAIHAVPLAEIDGEEFLDFTVRRPWMRAGEGGARTIEWPSTRVSYGATASFAQRAKTIGGASDVHQAGRASSWWRSARSRICAGAPTASCSLRSCAVCA